MRSIIVACFLALLSSTVLAEEGIPLNDLGPRPYRLGYFGGLWDNGSNIIPPDHLAAGLRLARQVQPLDENGQPSPKGKIVLIGIGNGDTTRVLCSFSRDIPCEPGSFMSLVQSNSRVNPALVVVNAAQENFYAAPDQIDDTVFDRIRANELDPADVTDQQVQVAWLQLSKDHPTVDLTCACGDSYNIKIDLSVTLRALQTHYPNIKLVYLSSRPYAGYSSHAWNTEPFAYDTAIAIRLVLLVQLDEVRTGFFGADLRVGQINYLKGDAPWIAWGPYMWANGTTPRSDGLTWLPEDYDGEFLSEKGAHKSADLLVDFMLNDPTARLWFVANATVPVRLRAVRH